MEKIQARIIIEILGRPKEHLLNGLKGLIEKLEGEKGITVTEKIINEPVLAKDSNDLYTTFAEITMDIDSIQFLFGIMFAYMPSHVEIIKPEKITLTNYDLGDYCSRIVERLHEYDAIAKKMIYENDILLKKLKEVAPHLFLEKKENIENLTKKEKEPEKKNKKKYSK